MFKTSNHYGTQIREEFKTIEEAKADAQKIAEGSHDLEMVTIWELKQVIKVNRPKNDTMTLEINDETKALIFYDKSKESDNGKYAAIEATEY